MSAPAMELNSALPAVSVLIPLVAGFLVLAGGGGGFASANG
jgi:hypothetical protein